MTDIVFVCSTDTLKLSREVNGTMLLATKLLQADFSVKVYRFAQNPEFNKNTVYSCDYAKFVQTALSQILKFDPQCVAFYTLWPYYHVMLRIAAEIKEKSPKTLVVLGGPQASATSMESMKAMPYIDYICTGEGENTVVPFFEEILRNKSSAIQTIPGLYYRRDSEICFNSINLPLCDLNTLPYWNESLYNTDYREDKGKMQSADYFMPIDVGRGCPFHCTFCCSSSFWRRTYRLKSAERIVSDIVYYNQKYGIRSFWFTHDAFTVNKKLVERVCDLLIRKNLGITWRCTTRIDCITEELLLKMKAAGMVGIELGVETGSERMQKLTNKRLDLQKAKDKVAFMLKNQITVSLFFMYGFPEETEEDLQLTLRLMFDLIDLGVKSVSMSFCRFNPSTVMTERFRDQLVFDPQMKILTRGVLGFEEEKTMIMENSAIFPFFYHLHTPVRDKYQYMHYLVRLYQQYPNSAKQLRKVYRGDCLQLYSDFIACNKPLFDNSIADVWQGVTENSCRIMENIASMTKVPYVKQLKSLIQFDYDYQMILRSEEGTKIIKRYEFNFLEFQMNLPIEQYSDGWTELQIMKRGKKVWVKIAAIS